MGAIFIIADKGHRTQDRLYADSFLQDRWYRVSYNNLSKYQSIVTIINPEKMSAKNNRIQGPSTSPTCSLLFCRFKKETQMSSDFEQTLFVIPILLQIIGERQATMLQRQMTSFIMGGLMDFCDTGDRFRIVEICHIIFYSAFATLHQ